MTAIGREDLANDPELARNEGRARRVEEIDGAIQAWCGRRPIDEALATLTTADVPASRIYSVADMVRDAQFQARGMFEQAALPDGMPMKIPAVVPKLSATPGGTRWLGPRLGEHTDDVLGELGYDADAIAALRQDGVI
jgi:formyl-CoA transferase